MSNSIYFNVPLDQPSTKEQGLAYREDDTPGDAKWMSPTDAQQRAKGNVLDSKPWAKPADAPKQGTPFKNLRSR